jgi:hypothetical protein
MILILLRTAWNLETADEIFGIECNYEWVLIVFNQFFPFNVQIFSITFFQFY